MAAKFVFILCVQALFVQCVFSQCTSRAAVDASGINAPFGLSGFAAPGLSYDGLAAPGYAYDRLAAPGYAYNRLATPGIGYPGAGRSLAYDGIYAPAMEFTATRGGALPVTSSSSIAPTGISVFSENMYEGALSVAGELPFVGTTAMEGVLPTAGSGAINHACGDGINAMSALSGTSTLASVATTAGPAFGGPALAYDGLYSPAISTPAYGSPVCGTPAFGYDGLRSTGFAAPAITGAALAAPIMAYDALPYGAPLEITPTSGGALPVSSASAIPPTGISVASDNGFEGILAVGGELPFVGTVAMEGVVPSAGAGAVNHACGNGRNAMISENAAYGPAAAASGFAAGLGAAGLGYPNRLAGMGYGCGF